MPPRRPLAPVSGNAKITQFWKRTRDDDDDDDEPAPKKPKLEPSSPDPDPNPPNPNPPTLSRTAAELADVTREQAEATLKRLRDGYKDKSGAGYAAAITNEAGCVLVQKVTNRKVSLPCPCV